MEFIIGRKDDTCQLSITQGREVKVWDEKDSVSKDVSRKHVSLTLQPDGETFILKNLNPDNETFVNGVSVMKRKVTMKDCIELGESHYLFDWNSIKEALPTVVDIRPLKGIWDNYEQTRLQMQLNEQKKNNLRNVGSILSMLGIMIMAIPGIGSIVRYGCTGIAIIIGVVFFVLGTKTDKSLTMKLHKLDKGFQRKYVCPNPKCQHFIGNKSYELLSQDKNCPYCKAIYKH